MRLFYKYFGGENMAPFHAAVARTIMTQLGILAFSTVMSVLISRTLGVDNRGIMSWMFAYSGFGSIFVALGMGQAIKKYIVIMPHHTSAFILVDVILLIISLLLFLPALYYYGLSAPIARQNSGLFLLALLFIPYLAFSGILNEILIGLQKNLHFNLLLLTEKITQLILNLALLAFGWVTPTAVVACYMIAVLCRVIAGIGFIRPYIRGLPSRRELWDAFLVMRKLIFSSYFSNLAMCYCGSLLTIVMGMTTTSTELGYFSIAKFVTDQALMLPGTLATFTLPQLAKEQTAEGRKKTKQHIIMLTLVMLLALALPMFIFPAFIIHLLFGQAFMPAAPCLHILAIGMIASGIIGVANSIIASQHQERLLMLNSGALALCITLFALLFSHDLNAVTASYIHSGAYVIGMIVALAIIIRTSKQRE